MNRLAGAACVLSVLALFAFAFYRWHLEADGEPWILRTGENIEYTGLLTEKAADQLEALDIRGVHKLSIKSAGGWETAAIRIGAWVQKNHLQVEVRDYCLSGCGQYVFVAAKKRSLRRGALVGCHHNIIAMSTVSAEAIGRPFTAEERNRLENAHRLYREAGVSENFAMECFHWVVPACVGLMDSRDQADIGIKAVFKSWILTGSALKRFGVSPIDGMPQTKHQVQNLSWWLLKRWSRNEIIIGDGGIPGTALQGEMKWSFHHLKRCG